MPRATTAAAIIIAKHIPNDIFWGKYLDGRYLGGFRPIPGSGSEGLTMGVFLLDKQILGLGIPAI